MLERSLIIVGSLIFLILGTIHLAYTFFTNKFMPGNPSTFETMTKDHPMLTRDTTMWKAWVGFNASHSAGAMFIGLFNLILATGHDDFGQSFLLLLILDDVTMLFYVFLAKKYWFKAPLIGILVSTVCFLVATVMTMANR